MTGIERLREFVAGISPFTVVCGVTSTAYDRGRTEEVGVLLRDFLADIADQIERELMCDADTIENIRLIVGGVVDEMEHHILGHEGMEDSPVARWARELREALVGNGRDHAADVSVSAYDLLPQEDREAIAWVREHGGLGAVKRRWECLGYYADPVPRSCMEKRLARLQRQIDESHAALRRRNQRIEELNHRASDLTRENAKLRKRAMPENLTHRAPALAADGKPLLKHETVYEIKTGERYFVTNVFDGMTEPDFPEHTVECRKYEDVVTHMFRPSQLTHQRPEIDSWERLEEEARSCTCVMEAIDLVRRARALAERERGE